jgi:methionine-rich copper-binding protein CopC
VPPAQAHAVLVSVTPADNSTVSRAPGRVMLVFDENIRAPSKIVVSGPSGQRVDRGTTNVVDNRVSVGIRLQPRPGDVGRYVIGYRVVSADGHVVSGQRTFDYRPPGVKAAQPADNPAASSSARGSGRTWWFVGAGLVVVAAIYLLLRPRRGSGARR